MAEETVKAMFVKLVNQVLADRDQIIVSCELIQQRFSDTASFEKETEKLRGELQTVIGQIRQLAERNAGAAIDEADYQKRYGVLEDRFKEIAEHIENVEEQIRGRKAKAEDIAVFATVLGNTNRFIADFDDYLWNTLVERVVIHPEGAVCISYLETVIRRNYVNLIFDQWSRICPYATGASPFFGFSAGMN